MDAAAGDPKAEAAVEQVERFNNLDELQEYLVRKTEPLYEEVAEQRDAFLESARSLCVVAFLRRDFAVAAEWGRRIIEFAPADVLARMTLGDIARTHGTLATAMTHYEAANRELRRLAENDSENTQWQRDLGVSCVKLSRVAALQGKRDEALSLANRAREVWERLVELDPTNATWREDVEKIKPVFVAP